MNRNHRRCASCIHYDGSICTKDINNNDYDNFPFLDELYVAPFDTCDDWEEDLEFEEDMEYGEGNE